MEDQKMAENNTLEPMDPEEDPQVIEETSAEAKAAFKQAVAVRRDAALKDAGRRLPLRNGSALALAGGKCDTYARYPQEGKASGAGTWRSMARCKSASSGERHGADPAGGQSVARGAPSESK